MFLCFVAIIYYLAVERDRRYYCGVVKRAVYITIDLAID